MCEKVMVVCDGHREFSGDEAIESNINKLCLVYKNKINF